MKYIVSANGTEFGTYEATSEQEARDLCARDAGYGSEDEMVERLGQESELVAEAVAAITCLDDAKRAFPNVLDDGWMWPEGSQLEKDIILWAKSPCKRLLTVEVEHEGMAHHFVFVDEDVIEQWGDLSAEQIPAAEDRAREFADGYRD